MAAIDQVMIRLNNALQGGVLPPEGRRIGQRLMTQLDQPTRIAVIGLPGSGKTALVNMLIGAGLMPDLAGVASVELSYGTEARSQITMLDGTLTVGEGQLQPSDLPNGAMRVCQQLADPRLKAWSFSEISLSVVGSGQADLLDWMAARSDIAIWCSQSFDDRERALWSKAPEHLKDHSFLALTRADRLYMKGELADRIARLQPIVADEFLALHPVATLQAAAARTAGAEVNEVLWQSSGGKALLNGIHHEIEQARTADLDHAFMLLERYKVPVPEQGKVADARPAAAPVPPQLAAARAIPLQNAHDASGDGVIEKALGLLQSCADDLQSERANGDTTERILARCTATADDLMQMLSASSEVTPLIEALHEDVFEGEQMLMLLRLERGETAAEDSLTVLLQLKKELSERVPQ
jgi:hypothetical protein